MNETTLWECPCSVYLSVFVYLYINDTYIPTSIVVAEKEDCRMDEMTDAPSLKLPEGRFMRARP